MQNVIKGYIFQSAAGGPPGQSVPADSAGGLALLPGVHVLPDLHPVSHGLRLPEQRHHHHRAEIQPEELGVGAAGQLLRHREPGGGGLHQLLRGSRAEAALAGRRGAFHRPGRCALLLTSLHLSAVPDPGTELLRQ